MQTQENNSIDTSVATPDFGKGTYSNLMSECYRDGQIVFGMSPAAAEKFARMAGNEVGAIFAAAKRELKFSKVSKDGKVSVKEAVEKVKGVTVTNTITLLRALEYVYSAGKYGFSYSKTEWKVYGDGILQNAIEAFE